MSKAQMTFEKNKLDNYAIMTEKAQIIIELPKFNSKKADRRDLLNAWLTFFKNPSDVLSRKIAEIDEAYEALKDVSADEKVRRTYQAILDKENDIESNRINSMKVARAEGLAEGRAEGEKIGMQKEQAKLKLK